MITVLSIVVTFAIVPTQFQKVLHILELQVPPAPAQRILLTASSQLTDATHSELCFCRVPRTTGHSCRPTRRVARMC